MISIPILRWTLGDGVLRWGVTATVLLLAAAVIKLLGEALGASTTWRLVLLITPLAWAVEWIGSNTGLPFGRYHYTDSLQPQLLGVPLIIPLAWLMMLPSAWAVAARIAAATRSWRFCLFSALAFTAWDLFLDPQMVGWGFWVWEQPGGYFGIPWLNFAGWLLCAALITGIVSSLVPLRLDRCNTPLLAVYAITWLLQTIGQFVFWGMPGPALIGGVIMGVFVLWASRLAPPT